MTAPHAQSTDVLPDSRLSTPHTVKHAVWRGNAYWQPVFCANCGANGGLVPEENMTFAFYLCPPCHDTYGTVAGTYAMPDEVFFRRLREVESEKYGHTLTGAELLRELENVDSPLSRLMRDRPNIIKGV